jgi:antitoxin component YwqK of YwqJK toxin-antitoxin module
MNKLFLILSLAISSNTFANSDIDFSLSDFCYEQPNVQDRNGIYFFPNEKIGITAYSECVYKDKYGQIKSKVNLKNGLFHGEHLIWFTNGQKATQGNYLNGKEEGLHYSWRNGQLTVVLNFSNGVLEGKAIHGTPRYWDKHASRWEGNYLNGERNGKWHYWIEDFLAEEVIYNKGLKDGPWLLYHPQFGKVVTGNYKKDKADGNWSWFLGKNDGNVSEVWQKAMFKEGGKYGDCQNLLEDRNGVTKEQITLLMSDLFRLACDVKFAESMANKYRDLRVQLN